MTECWLLELTLPLAGWYQHAPVTYLLIFKRRVILVYKRREVCNVQKGQGVTDYFEI